VIDNAGGLKLFCLDHADKIQWISSGSGHVQLVKTAVGRRASAMSGSAGVGILFIQVATEFSASAPALRLVAHTLTVRSQGLQDGPPATVRYVVKDGPAANSARPPLPGDMLVKVHNSLARGRSLSQSIHTHTHSHTHTHTRLTATMCGGSASRSCGRGSRARRAVS
jgi:hypothetical protein